MKIFSRGNIPDMGRVLLAALVVSALLWVGCDTETQSQAPPRTATADQGSKEIVVQMPTVEQKENECRQTATAYFQQTYGTEPPLPDERWRFGWDYSQSRLVDFVHRWGGVGQVPAIRLCFRIWRVE